MTTKLYKGALLRKRLPRGKFEFHRVAAVFEETDDIFLLEISGETTTSTRLPVRRSYARVASSLSDSFEIVKEDTFLLPEMLMLDSELSNDVKKTRDSRYEKIESLVTENERQLFDKRERASLLAKHAERVGTGDVTLRRLLVTYWTFGCNANAMIELRSRAGAPGVQRSAAKTPTGRPNASVILFGDAGSPNRITTETDKRRIRLAMEKYFIADDANYAETYRNMVEYMYAGKDAPEMGTFYYYAKGIASESAFLKAKAGEQEWREIHGNARGRARDLSDGPCDIYDVDGTPFPQELVASWAPARAIRKPTLMLCVDRHSLAITGFYDSMQPENWDAYRMCLFNAMTSKHDMLVDLGFDPKDWDLVQAPAGVFFDRGPAITDKAQVALCNELKIEPIWAPPGHPEGKPTVEGMFAKLQNRMAGNPGGSKTSKRKRDKERAQKAVSNAQWSPQEFRRELIKEIIKHNRFTRVPHLLTKDMRDDNVDPTPEEIFKWGRNQLHGDRARVRAEEEIYFALLPREHMTVWPNGIRYKGHAYSSNGLLDYRLQHISVIGKSKSCKTYVYVDPLMPSRLYWRNPSGRKEVLLPDEHSLALLENQTWLDMELERLIELTKAKVSRKAEQAWSRKHHLTRKQEETIAPALPRKAGKPKVIVEGSAEARSLEKRLQLNEQRRRFSTVVEKLVSAETPQSLPPTPDVTPAASPDAPKRKSILDRMFDE
ncbi:hypothetical protein LGM38_02185 [Burkholderia vietnamiensis]|uniref:hypothetical protein n=1 Tax=Burkholderia vietnamiensis TaxID=60552 RepID=UPI001CF53C65|nr:hypothetical protein [Burkholderia vietnamiensis]MCA8010874.1 hypothetical protein [Burkholderia vietnamiensis]HDR8937579.1 hypothetical protein [Burkholderia vietnamiensis]HDR9265895.1 hypothetical protein [Burkholderia vietnamiensis]